MAESSESTSTETVFVLTPPAVEPLAPPMNINRIVSRITATRVSMVMGMTLNPAVRGVTAVKKEESSRHTN